MKSNKIFKYFEVPTVRGGGFTYKYSSQWDKWLLPKQFKKVTSAEEADFLIFTGGADVSPVLYNQRTGATTHTYPRRDQYEAQIFKKWVGIKPMVGYCRGSQFLTVMSGGKLIQDFSGHASRHCITTNEGERQVNSTHHQMMYPYDMNPDDYSILAGLSPANNSYHLNGDNKQIEYPDEFLEVESAYYPKTNCLGFQFHPEWGSCPESGRKWSRETILKLLNKQL